MGQGAKTPLFIYMKKIYSTPPRYAVFVSTKTSNQKVEEWKLLIQDKERKKAVSYMG